MSSQNTKNLKVFSEYFKIITFMEYCQILCTYYYLHISKKLVIIEEEVDSIFNCLQRETS